jgi:hypothetical protein
MCKELWQQYVARADECAQVLALLSIFTAVSRFPRATLSVCGRLISATFVGLRSLSAEIEYLFEKDRPKPLDTSGYADPTGGGGADALSSPRPFSPDPTRAGAFAGGARGGGQTETRVLPGYLERVGDRRSQMTMPAMSLSGSAAAAASVSPTALPSESDARSQTPSSCPLGASRDILSRLLRHGADGGLQIEGEGDEARAVSGAAGGGGGRVRGLSDLEIAAILGDIMIAGGGSTGDGIATTLWRLSSEPGLLVRVRSEVDSVFGAGCDVAEGEGARRRPGLDDIKNLPFTTCVVKEVLRRSAFASVTFRVARTDALLTKGPSPQLVPRGAGLIMSPQVLG